MFWKPICVILNRASFTWLLYCLTKVELTSAWSSVAMMFVLISGYLGIWMDMICVAFWKITVVLCSHMSLQRQEYLVFLMAQRKKWKTQHSCGKLLTSTWLPEGMKLFQQLRSHNPDETMRISVWSTCLKVWQCTLWYYVSKLLRHPFSIFRSVPFLCNEFKMSSLVPHHPFYFLSTELVQTNWRASSVPTTHEFLDWHHAAGSSRMAWAAQAEAIGRRAGPIPYEPRHGGIYWRRYPDEFKDQAQQKYMYTILWNQRYCFHDNIIILMMLQNLLVSKLAIALIRIRITSQFPSAFQG